jgi:hypothetical protein
MEHERLRQRIRWRGLPGFDLTGHSSLSPEARAAPDDSKPWMLMRRLCWIAAALVGFAALSSCGSNSVQPSRQLPDSVAGTGHDWVRFGWDAGRSSASTAPTGITASNVASMVRQQVSIPGTADASVIYLSNIKVGGAAHDVFFLTTTYGKTVAINANTGALLWTYTPANYDSWAGSAQVTTATPVADPSREFIYAASPDGNIQRLAVSDGHMVWSTAITLRPQSEKLASPLNYFAGHIVETTGGYVGDAPPYQGHVAILDAASGQLLHTWNSLCSDQPVMIAPADCPQSGSAIWGRGGAVIDSATGEIYVATGNGLWDGNTNWGDALIRLDSTATHIVGNYTPANTGNLDSTDQDLGSTSPVLLGGGYIAQGGKDGKIRIVTVAGTAGATAHLGGEVQVTGTPNATDLFSSPAVYHTTAGTLFFGADNEATAAWTFSNGTLTLLWRNSNVGTSPVVAGGLLFIYDQGGNGLRVYDPASGTQITALAAGVGHWNSPIVADGRIAVPEGSSNDHASSGILDIWRLP